MTISERDISLQYHSELNPVLFDGSHLRPEVRAKMLLIAEEWRKFAGIPDYIVKDIVFTGSNANYNYNATSDIDVHLIIDKTEYKLYNADVEFRAFVDEYLMLKKAAWAIRHHITIRGYNVEMYAQDLAQGYQVGEAVYSIKDDVWIQSPTFQNLNFSNNIELRAKADELENQVDMMIQNNADPEIFHDLRQKFYQFRLDGLKNGGEFGFGNLLFKELRNRGVFDRMNTYILKKYDERLSEDGPTNSMGASAGGSGPIAAYSPFLFKTVVKRGLYNTFKKRKGLNGAQR